MKAQHSSIGHEFTSSNVAGAIFAHPRRQFIGRNGGRPPGDRLLKADAAHGRQDADTAAKFLVDVFARRAIWRKIARGLPPDNAIDGP
ncbi:MAG: hypothetical protein E5X80_30455 [Mesorhizobium sp.]|uniref:hypothetical protein n=1 Tax=Mesorhizobium sp. TaxID=1871066 RepID=UPI000FE6379F|nr:hypothetical protein [Mesorhizobium sp.]RWM04205.1 MAG: hypothetical protein EOR71_26630 [Mesorhizobium sp.]TIO48954.1 MAG: hypothetical protein E5X78_27790 [Mesorhizobium sp.]TIO57097.1 MAG: hypothetical protein E5X79_27705 [Mesorhizobium sp.]TJV57423.1 MAG: hypothetical protein E5X80_30455 [Mesorhizobium sp.]